MNKEDIILSKIFFSILQLILCGAISLLSAGMIVDGVNASPLFGLFVGTSSLIIIHISERMLEEDL